MKSIFLLVIAFFTCLFFFACGGQNGMTPPTMNDLQTNTMASPSGQGVPSPAPGPSPAAGEGENHHVTADLISQNGSGVTGHVTVEQLPHGGVNISVVAFGLVPGEDYLSLYYENHTCALEPYEEDDVIGTYTGDAAGEGHTQNKLGDDLDEVNSISVRRASDFELQACADIHP